MFLAVVRAHTDAATREALTQLLFNLIKKPNAAQRRSIMDGYAAAILRTMDFEMLPHVKNVRRGKSRARRQRALRARVVIEERWRIALAVTGGIPRVRDNSAAGCRKSQH